MTHLRTAFSHLRRAPYQALAALMIMSLTFFVATIFALLTAGSLAALHYFETRPQVSAFLADDLKPAETENLKSKIQALENVREVKYISKEEALAIYREQNRNEPLLLEMVTANILPASLEISTTDLASLKAVAQALKNQKGVEEVVFQEEVINALSNLTAAIKKIGVGVLSFLGLVSLLIVLIIIGMKIALRREEIEILGLVGATRFYISWPFVLEGMIYGAGGALFGWIGGYLLLLYASPFLASFMAGVPIFPIPPIFMFGVLGAEMLVGIFLGGLGSLAAVRRYLK
jgi:cell division transport system permease protein